MKSATCFLRLLVGLGGMILRGLWIFPCRTSHPLPWCVPSQISYPHLLWGATFLSEKLQHTMLWPQALWWVSVGQGKKGLLSFLPDEAPSQIPVGVEISTIPNRSNNHLLHKQESLCLLRPAIWAIHRMNGQKIWNISLRWEENHIFLLKLSFFSSLLPMRFSVLMRLMHTKKSKELCSLSGTLQIYAGALSSYHLRPQVQRQQCIWGCHFWKPSWVCFLCQRWG